APRRLWPSRGRRGLGGRRAGGRGAARVARVDGRRHGIRESAAQCAPLPRAAREPRRRTDRHDLNGTGTRADHRAAASLRSVTLSAPAGARAAPAARRALALIILLACLLATGSCSVYFYP